MSFHTRVKGGDVIQLQGGSCNYNLLKTIGNQTHPFGAIRDVRLWCPFTLARKADSEITDLHAGKTSRWNRISAVEARHAYLNS